VKGKGPTKALRARTVHRRRSSLFSGSTSATLQFPPIPARECPSRSLLSYIFPASSLLTSISCRNYYPFLLRFPPGRRCPKLLFDQASPRNNLPSSILFARRSEPPSLPAFRDIGASSLIPLIPADPWKPRAATKSRDYEPSPRVGPGLRFDARAVPGEIASPFSFAGREERGSGVSLEARA